MYLLCIEGQDEDLFYLVWANLKMKCAEYSVVVLSP